MSFSFINITMPTYLFLYFSLLILLSSIIARAQPPYGGNSGRWQLLQANIGVSAMHMQLLHNNKVIIFDRTDFGRSNLSLPNGQCRRDPNDIVLKVDCTAHSLLYDVLTNTFRPLVVQTDTWCSSGAVLPNGTFVQSGGYNDGDHVVRLFNPCGDHQSCDWIEYRNYLTRRRWYATNQILPDGRVIIIGGRRQYNYEFYPKQDGTSSISGSISLQFLAETRDDDENNLYPFVHLLPNGNLFVFANTRSIELDYKRNRVTREFPRIPNNHPRNYPSSGSSVMLPIDENKATIEVEVMICGGAPRGAFDRAGRGIFSRAISSCGRIRVTDENPSWTMERMPMPRVMSDMLLLPTGDVIIINGAESGTAGWELGRSPVTRPVIYRPQEQPNRRFSVMACANRPRMYHSSAILLLDGRILVGGSNPHVYYNFTNVEYPTDLSLEAYSPPYLSIEYEQIRPRILSMDTIIRLGQGFSITFYAPEYYSASEVTVRIVAPSFTTHSLAMNQRMVVLSMIGITSLTSDMYNLTVMGPSTAEIAPPGYYMLFVVHASLPSSGFWVRLAQ